MQYKPKASDFIYCFGDLISINNQLLLKQEAIDIVGLDDVNHVDRWIKPSGVMWRHAQLGTDSLYLKSETAARSLLAKAVVKSRLMTITYRIGPVHDKGYTTLKGGSLLIPRAYRSALLRHYPIGEAVIDDEPIAIIYGKEYTMLGCVIAKRR